MNILLIGSYFFGYIERIAKFLSQTNNVNIIYEYKVKAVERIMNFCNVNITNKNKYYEFQYRKIQDNKYDVIIVMGGRSLTLEFMNMIKNRFHESKFVLYLSADYIEYNFNSRFISFFDSIYTYSLFESKKYGFIYLPWFFTDFKIRKEKEIDISFIGSIHSGRLKYINLISCFDEISFFNYLYSDKISFFKDFFIWHKYIKNIHFKELPYYKYIDILSKSIATLDLPELLQTNITTRPIEALGTSTKIITTNPNIKLYDFYNKDNIFILNENNNFNYFKDWLSTPYKELNQNILNKYYIKNWIDEILK